MKRCSNCSYASEFNDIACCTHEEMKDWDIENNNFAEECEYFDESYVED